MGTWVLILPVETQPRGGVQHLSKMDEKDGLPHGDLPTCAIYYDGGEPHRRMLIWIVVAN